MRVGRPPRRNLSCAHIVQDGETALAYLNGEGQYADRHAHPLPDLVLLDITLPGMNGLDLLAWIRQHPDFRALKVFVWTDSGDPAVLERALKAGANRFVPKSASFVHVPYSRLDAPIPEPMRATKPSA